MTDVSPQEEVPDEEELPEAPDPESLAADLGLDLSPEERAEADQMVARLRTQFGLDGEEEVPDETPGEEPAEEPEPTPEPEPVQPVASDDWITIDGRTVPVAEARSMLELRQYLAQHPEKADAVRAAIEGTPEVKKEPEPVQPPEWLDLEDPSQKFFWERTQQLEKAVSTIADNQRVSAEQQARTDALAAVNSAMTTFRTSHPELTEDEVQIVRTHAVALNIIPGLQQTRSGTDAVLKALDIAYMDHPEFRAKQTGQPTPKEKKAAEATNRRQKLAGVAGSGSTATRTPEPPKRAQSDPEMKAQAVAWLKEQNIL